MSDEPSIASEKTLAGKIAVVTGSSSGIGKAIAIGLANRGAGIILHGRAKSPRLESVAAEIDTAGGQCITLCCDFARQPDWGKLVDEAFGWKGKVDFWINNAGGDVLTGDWPDRDLEAKLAYLWQVDVTASLMLSRKVGERMVAMADENSQPSGSNVILNMGWDQAWQGMAGPSGELFATTKGAIMAMTKSLAQSLAPRVRVNCLAPGWIKTDWGAQASEYWSARAKRESLMERWGTPQDVASVATFLCSDAASFISGQIVPINGGFRFGDGASR